MQTTPYRVLVSFGLLVAAGGAMASPGRTPELYPEGLDVPRHAADFERDLEALMVPTAPPRMAPPTLSVYAPPEHAPCDAIIMTYEGSSSWNVIQHQMAREITTTGNADVIMMADSTSERNSIISALTSAGANMSRVTVLVQQTDTIWARDFGPRTIVIGADGRSPGVRGVADHTYNRPTRTRDNALPQYIATVYDRPYFLAPLVHGGGNYHIAGAGFEPAGGFATELIENENPSLSASQIVDIWQDYWGIQTEITPAYPPAVDATQHIDMWFQVVGDKRAVVSYWPTEPTSSWAITSDNLAAELEAAGWTIVRTPARRSGFTHYTYTNVVICNDLILIPSYTSSTVSSYNSQALAAWQTIAPEKTIVQINCQDLVTAAGVMHCIVKHVPLPPSGEIPSAVLEFPRGGEAFELGETITARWMSDDDEAVTGVDVLLSLDGGQTYPTTLVSGGAKNGSFSFAVPSVDTDKAIVRVVAHDVDGHTGETASLAFTIGDPTTCVADLAAPFGTLNFADVQAFLAAFGLNSADADLAAPAGVFNFADVQVFLAAFGAGC